MLHSRKLVADTSILLTIVAFAAFCAVVASRPFTHKDNRTRLEESTEKLHAIQIEVDRAIESVKTKGVTDEDRNKFGQLREEIYENQRELEDIEAGRMPRNFFRELFHGLLAAHILLVNLLWIFARRLDKPLEFSASKTAYEPLTYHSIEE